MCKCGRMGSPRTGTTVEGKRRDAVDRIVSRAKLVYGSLNSSVVVFGDGAFER